MEGFLGYDFGGLILGGAYFRNADYLLVTWSPAKKRRVYHPEAINVTDCFDSVWLESHLYNMMGFIDCKYFKNCTYVGSVIVGDDSLKNKQNINKWLFKFRLTICLYTLEFLGSHRRETAVWFVWPKGDVFVSIVLSLSFAWRLGRGGRGKRKARGEDDKGKGESPFLSFYRSLCASFSFFLFSFFFLCCFCDPILTFDLFRLLSSVCLSKNNSQNNETTPSTN